MADVPERGRLASRVATAWSWLVDGLTAFGSILIVVLMGIICSDVVARNLFGSSLPLIAELSALTLVMIVYLQLGATIRHNRLARADIIFGALLTHAPLLARILQALFDLAGAAAIGLIAWSTLGILGNDIDRGQYIGVTGVMTLPTWPFRVMILFGLTVATLQFIVQFAAAFRRQPPGAEGPS